MLPSFHSVREIVDFVEQNQLKLSFGDAQLDAAAARALNSLGVVEIFGQSSSGKSTMAMQVVLDCLIREPNIRALYIYTGKPFSIERLKQLIEERHFSCSFEEISERLIIQQLGDLDRQVQFFESNLLEQFAMEANVRIVVVDTVSANFRSVTRDVHTSYAIYKMAQRLHTLHHDFMVSVICLNEISAVIVDENGGDYKESVIADDQQNLETNSTLYKPVLGLPWTNSISSRMEISRVANAEQSQHRILRVHFSPDQSSKQICCKLDSNGFSSLENLAG